MAMVIVMATASSAACLLTTQTADPADRVSPSDSLVESTNASQTGLCVVGDQSDDFGMPLHSIINYPHQPELQPQKVRQLAEVSKSGGMQDVSQRQALLEALDAQLSVVLVLDTAGFDGNYETVPVTGLTKAGLLPWVAKQVDAFTATDEPGDFRDGLPLKTNPFAKTACTSYADCISDALQRDDAASAAAAEAQRLSFGSEKEQQPVTIRLPTMMLVAYHMTQFPVNITRGAASLTYVMPPNRVRFTTVESFFAAAEATSLTNFNIQAAGGSVLRTVSGWNLETNKPKGNIVGLAGSVLILPRWVPLVNNGWHVTSTRRFGDPFKWTPSVVMTFATHFVDVAQVKPVPALEEWTISADKLLLQEQWRAGYAADPEHGTPLLEMVPVEVPLRASEAVELCWSSTSKPTETAIKATMKAIFESIVELHDLVPHGSEERFLATPEDPVTRMQSYVLKRTFSEASVGITFFNFPSHLLKVDAKAEPWLERGVASFNTISDAKTDVRSSMVEPLQYLRKVALHALREGCSCKWLLQFEIKDFALTEYSVYLMGGADASPENAWVAYKPTLQNHEASPGTSMFLSIGISDVPRGHFANELLPDWESDDVMRRTIAAAQDAAGELPPGPMRSDTLKSQSKWRGQSSWPSPKMYDAVVQAGLNGAKAVAAGRGQDGRLLRPTLQHTFIRVDVAIFMPWNKTSGRHEVVPRINELGWVNDAATMLTNWDRSIASLAAGSICSFSMNATWHSPCTDATSEQLKAAMRASQRSSPAAAYAKALLRQVAWTSLGIDGQSSNIS